MIKHIKRATQVMILFVLLGASVFSYSLMHAQPVQANCQPGGGALPVNIFVPWYKYLDCDQNGAPEIDEWGHAIPLIGMAVLEMLTRIAGLIAIGFIIWGGIQYTTSQGEPDGINNAKSTILNAVIGLVISLVAVGLVQFVAGLMK